MSYILLKNVINPTVLQSSYFQVCIRKSGVLLECQKDFSRTFFTDPAAIYPTGISVSPQPSPAYINRGTTYLLKMTVSSNVLSYASENLKVRVKMPAEFQSDGPLCSIADLEPTGAIKLYQQVSTYILPASPSEVDCGSTLLLASWLGNANELTLKLENMINPLGSQLFTGF